MAELYLLDCSRLQLTGNSTVACFSHVACSFSEQTKVGGIWGEILHIELFPGGSDCKESACNLGDKPR